MRSPSPDFFVQADAQSIRGATGNSDAAPGRTWVRGRTELAGCWEDVALVADDSVSLVRFQLDTCLRTWTVPFGCDRPLRLAGSIGEARRRAGTVWMKKRFLVDMKTLGGWDLHPACGPAYLKVAPCQADQLKARGVVKLCCLSYVP